MKLIVSILVLLCQITLMAQKPTIQGHRGCRGEFPENTLPAFQHALYMCKNSKTLPFSGYCNNVECFLFFKFTQFSKHD